MGPPTPAASQKRKAAGPVPGASTVARKRQKYQDARAIPVQSTDKALSQNGELSINHFIQAREYEIAALDKSMRKARQNLMTRAFQSVPRHMRRRTASHNAKKVPRRLRIRAVREMKDDNTPTVTSRTRTPTSRLRLRLQNAMNLKKYNAKQQSVRQKRKQVKTSAVQSDLSKHISLTRVPRIKKNALAGPPTATSKFKRRQLDKTWLPTHLWHTKRAHMTRPVEPLWRMAIPLSPTEKNYRPTHRAANSRGALAWDMSYISTIGCLGTLQALENLLKAFKFHGEGWTGPRYERWRDGTRFATSWIRNRTNREELIAPILVIWAPRLDEDTERAPSSDAAQKGVEKPKSEDEKGSKRNKRLDRRLLIRIHPSAFKEFWTTLVEVAKMQKPQVLVEDLRFEIGSIDIVGPGSAEALNAVLNPHETVEPAAKLWSILSSVTNSASLPLNALLAVNVKDPRLNHPPKQLDIVQTSSDDLNVLEALTNWPLDGSNCFSNLFSHRHRHRASKLPSQKEIKRQRARSISAQNDVLSSDTPAASSIPILILAQRADDTHSTSQGTWTVLAPWNCIDPIWRSLMYYPLCSGGHPRFGGLQQKQQISFERSSPWFPADMPGTEAGKAWERTQAEKQFDLWIGKPPSRRLAFHSIDLGLGRRGELGIGWKCDWDHLLRHECDGQTPDKPAHGSELIIKMPPAQQTPLTQRQRRAARLKEETLKAKLRERNTSSPESDNGDGILPTSIDYCQIAGSTATSIFEGSPQHPLPAKPALVSIRITLLTKGTPSHAARIYRIPLKSPAPPTQTTQQDLSPVNATPPPAQRSPATPESQTSIISSDLRNRWLEVYKSSAQLPAHKGGPKHIPKPKTNHHSLPRQHQVHPAPDLRHVIVLPPNAPQEVIDQHGPKALTESERKAHAEQQLRVHLIEQSVWDDHVPCPDENDLIGFVTTAGFNLAEGRGTAIGSIWVQRVAEGWHEVDGKTASVSEREMLDPKKVRQGATEKKIQQRQKDGERYLCIVRNAGESVGRLGIWEVCQQV